MIKRCNHSCKKTLLVSLINPKWQSKTPTWSSSNFIPHSQSDMQQEIRSHRQNIINLKSSQVKMQWKNFINDLKEILKIPNLADMLYPILWVT
jgi:hypothetical protein